MRCAGVIVLILLLVGSGAGQDWSPLVLPSEEELLEALREGEIDYEQYVILQELLAFGIAPWQVDLLNEIPNLSLGRYGDTLDELASEQARAYVSSDEPTGGVGGVITHRLGTEADGLRRSRYRTTGRLSLNERWSLRGQVQREFTGRERVTERSIEYRGGGEAVERAVVGNFNERMGLGTVIGRRGKLLKYDQRMGGESWLFPDNGGYNGVLAVGKAGNAEWKSFLSCQRDSAYMISTAAVAVGLPLKTIQPSLFLGSTQLQRRGSNNRDYVHSAGVNMAWRYRYGSVEAEIAAQQAGRVSSLSAVIEGQHKAAWGDIRYSLWNYADAYNDLTSGSRSARISRNRVSAETGFEYASRRSGQHGGIVRYSVDPVAGYELTVGLLYGRLSRDTSLLQIAAGLTRRISKSVSLTVSSDDRRLRRFQVGAAEEDVRRQTRVEARYAGRQIRLRGYVARGTQTGRRDFWGLFTSLRWTTHTQELVEAWSNFGRIEGGNVAYWYGFLRHEQEIVEHFSVGVKLAQSYRRADIPKRSTTIVLEATSRF